MRVETHPEKVEQGCILTEELKIDKEEWMSEKGKEKNRYEDDRMQEVIWMTSE